MAQPGYDRYFPEAAGGKYTRGQYSSASMSQGGTTVAGLGGATLVADDIAGNEANLVADMQREDSAAAYAYGARDMALKLRSFIANGDMAGAKEYRDGIRAQVARSRDVLLDLVQIKHAGDTGSQVASGALFLLNGDYNQVGVVLGDGTEATVGQVMSDDGYFIDGHRKSLMEKGFSEATANAYYSGDEGVRSLVRHVVDPLVRNQTKDRPTPLANRIQANDVIEFFTADDGAEAHRASQLFGDDGARAFVDAINLTHQFSGANRASAKTLLAVAEGIAGQTGASGYDLLNRVISGYQNTFNRVTGGLRTTKDGHVMFGPEDRDNQLMYDAAMSRTLEGLASRGVHGLDVTDNPMFDKSVKDVMELDSYFDDMGVDLAGETVLHGASFSRAAGDYACDAMTGGATPGNLITSLFAFRSGLDASVTGGIDPVRDMDDPEVQKLAKAGLTLTAEKSVDAADHLAHGVKRALSKALVPRMLDGERADQALTTVLAGFATRKALSDGLYSELRGSFAAGRSGDEAVRALADRIMDLYSREGRVNLSNEVSRLAYSERSPLARKPAALRVVRDWVSGNVLGDDERIGSWRTTLTEYAKTMGMDANHAAHYASRIVNDLPALARNGVDPQKRIEKMTRRVMMLDEVFREDPNGKVKTKDGKTGSFYITNGLHDPMEYAKKHKLTLDQVWDRQMDLLEKYRESMTLKKRTDELNDFAAKQRILGNGKSSGGFGL